MNGKIKALIVNKLAKGLSRLFNKLPVQHNKVFLYSYYGSQYGCNPKYITEYIQEHYPKDYFDIVWSFNQPAGEQAAGTDFRKVKTMSLRYFYERATSKIIITNFRTTDNFVKRKEQYYIQTWHSSLRLKQIEQDAEHSLPPHYVEMAKKDSMKCDLLLSGSKHSSEIIRRAFWYKGKIFEQGTPRNDIFFQKHPAKKEKILEQLGNVEGKKVVLYAPTFRKNNSLECYNMDYAKVLAALQAKYQEDWVFLVKLHPHLASFSSQLNLDKQVIDVTAFDDIQELLFVADVLITDYSSLMFDFSITRRPCFLYTPDKKEYTERDRNLYFDLETLPFVNAGDTDELTAKIKTFDEADYHRNLEAFFSGVGSFEQGNACESLLSHMEEVCFGKKRRKFNEAV